MESFKEIWQMVLKYCRENVNEVSYTNWISQIEPISLDSGTATVYVKNEFQKKIITENYVDLLKTAFETVCGFPVDFVILSAADTEASTLNEQRITLSRGKSASELSKTHYDYTFDTFIVGPSNRLAHAAALSAVKNTGLSKSNEKYNPLFIYGNSGLGKTHLLNAICYEVQRTRPDDVIIYVTAEEFTNEFVNHVRHNTTNVFHEKYRNADILLIDDVQFIGGKEQTEEEFFHTFNTLDQNGKRIVLTSDRPPKNMPILSERIRSRFEWGLIVDIQPPEFETRIAIIKRKAELLELEIDDSVVEFIAEKIKKNIRQLESVVRKLNAYYIIDNIKPSIQVAQVAIKDITSDSKPVKVLVNQIISEVSRTFGVSEANITSKMKSAEVSHARQISMYIIREMTGISMKEIGSYFGGRDYSTTIYSIGQVKKSLETDSSLSNMINMIIKNVSEE